MTPWLLPAAAVGCAAAGVAGALACSRLPRPWWTVGYFVPLGVIVAIRLAQHYPALALLPVLSTVTGGAARYSAMSLCVPMMFVTALVKLDCRRKKVLAGLLAGLVVVAAGIIPLAAPALAYGRLVELETRLDEGGVCRQSTGFTCGPAAAVTALRALGLDGEEGEIAVAAHTSPTAGTDPFSLCKALRGRYGTRGLTCEYRGFGSVAELARLDGLGETAFVLAIVKWGFLVDHYVTVLRATDEHVTVGDPVAGQRTYTHAEFERVWRFTGIVISRPAVCVAKGGRT